jgi:hypothetical protein
MGDDSFGVSSSSGSSSKPTSNTNTSSSGISGSSGSSSGNTAAQSSQSYSGGGKPTGTTSGTSGLDDRLNNMAQTATGGNGSGSGGGTSQTGSKGTNTASSDGDISWSDGKARKLIRPDKPDIQLSEESKKKIESNLTLTISFSVNEAGDIPIDSIKISPPLQWSDVMTDIQQYISRNWRFEARDSKGLATFTYTIKVK